MPPGASRHAGVRAARLDNVGDTLARFAAHYLLAEEGGARITLLAP